MNRRARSLAACAGGALLMTMLAAAAVADSDFVALDPARFRAEIDSKKVELYTLKNSHGMIVRITKIGRA